jgi:hypothetical protein
MKWLGVLGLVVFCGCGCETPQKPVTKNVGSVSSQEKTTGEKCDAQATRIIRTDGGGDKTVVSPDTTRYEGTVVEVTYCDDSTIIRYADGFILNVRTVVQCRPSFPPGRSTLFLGPDFRWPHHVADASGAVVWKADW